MLPRIRLPSVVLCLVATCLGGCTFDDQFNDPAWKGKTWIDPEPGEELTPTKVHGGII
jgi:hypothetical protein